MPPQYFNNSYILTTRDQPKATSKSQIYPLPTEALWWYTAPKQYDSEVMDYTAVGPPGWGDGRHGGTMHSAGSGRQPGYPKGARPLASTKAGHAMPYVTLT